MYELEHAFVLQIIIIVLFDIYVNIIYWIVNEILRNMLVVV